MVASLAACGATNADGTEGVAGDEAEPLQSGESVSGESAVGAVSGEAVELTVFAAASMTETMNEIANLYKEVAPNVVDCVYF